jgi:hypothetical protein
MGFNYDTWGGSWSTAWLNSWGQQGAPAPEQPSIPPGGGRGLDYLSWWEREWDRIRTDRAERKRRKLPKKKREVLDELDEILLELRSRIDEAPEAVEPKIVEDYRIAEQFHRNAMNAEMSLKEMRSYLALAMAIRQELDDEEAIILAIH